MTAGSLTRTLSMGRLMGIGLTVAAAVLLGAATTLDANLTFVIAAIIYGLLLLAAPAAIWVSAALVSAIALRGLVGVGLLPDVMAFADIPMAWAALAAALLRARRWSPPARSAVRLLAALSAAVVASWAFHPSEALRPVLFLALLGEPFAVLAALLIDPPSRRMRRILFGTLGGLLIIQLPVGVWQVAAFGIGDPLLGTLHGTLGGTKAMSGLMVLGGFWILARGGARRLGTLLLAVAFFAWPLLAIVRQVALALPVAFLGSVSRHASRFSKAGSILLVAGAVSLALLPVLPAEPVLRVLDRAVSDTSGKLVAFDIVTEEISKDPASLFFGVGPATTVTRAAFLTTDYFVSPKSALRLLDLEANPVTLQAAARVLSYPGQTLSSVNSGLSSAIGVLGDLGLVGFGVYVAGLVWLVRALRRTPLPEARVAGAGWAMGAVLAVAFDWWEQPPFMLFVAAMTALALSEPEPEAEPS
ncbi:MAG: hypothetical protein ACRDH6_04860 [Actinomycetota bacterium]